MILSDLSFDVLRSRLSGPGLLLRTGDYVLRIRSRLSALAGDLALMYGDSPLVPDGAFADFPVTVDGAPAPRRWLRPQARFFAGDIQPFAPVPSSQALPLLEWGLNWCISNLVHDRLVLHAAVLERNGACLILPGSPGAGKSTLCAALAQAGWRLFSDELTLVDLDAGLIHPLSRPISLKNRSISLLREQYPQAVFSRSVDDTVKGTVALMRPPRDSVLRANECAPARWLVFPQYQADAATRLSPVSRGRAFMRVAEQGYNYGRLGPRSFDTLSDLVQGCQCHDFCYSRLEEAVALLSALE